MILVDTSVWVGHFRRSDALLSDLLEDARVITHPMVIAEIACGTFPHRAEVIEMLRCLPAAPVASDDEALVLIEQHRLMGRGIGYVDVHLLASALLAEEVRLWTADARLQAAAERLSVVWEPD